MFVMETSLSRAATTAFEGSTGTLNWMIQLEGVETETDVHDYILANAPATFIARTGSSYKYQSESITPNEVGNGIIDVVITYAQTKPLQFTFQTGGGSEKIDYSLGTMHTYTAAGKDLAANAPDFEQGINVTKTSVEGVTIKTAQFQFKLTKSWAKGKTVNAYGTFAGRTAHNGEAAGYRYLSTDGDGTADSPATLYLMGSGGSGDWSAAPHIANEIDGAYMRDIKKMSPCVNESQVVLLVEGIWMIFAAGELLFEGTDGGKTVDDRFELTYSFSESHNIDSDPEDPDDPDGRMIGAIYVSEARGHDLLWVYSEEATDSTSTLVRTPKAVYVERVYKYENFSKLRLDE